MIIEYKTSDFNPFPVKTGKYRKSVQGKPRTHSPQLIVEVSQNSECGAWIV